MTGQNTKISILYRDACNYKSLTEVVIHGAITKEQIDTILNCLDDGELFYPEQVGFDGIIRMPGYPFDPDLDTAFCELNEDSFELTSNSPTSDLTVSELVRNFLKAKDHWDVSGFVPWNMEGKEDSEEDSKEEGFLTDLAIEEYLKELNNLRNKNYYSYLRRIDQYLADIADTESILANGAENHTREEILRMEDELSVWHFILEHQPDGVVEAAMEYMSGYEQWFLSLSPDEMTFWMAQVKKTDGPKTDISNTSFLFIIHDELVSVSLEEANEIWKFMCRYHKTVRQKGEKA